MCATPSWDDLRFLVLVAKERTLRAAARRLGVDASTLSRRMAGLEGDLGVRLFDRLPSGIALTPSGERMLKAGQRMEEEILAATRSVVGQDAGLEGTLRLTTTDPLATRLLMPYLADFAGLHPEIELEIASTYEFLSLARREAEVAIRVARTVPDGLVGTRLAKVAVAVYASTEWVGSEEGEADLDRAPWIAWESEELNRNHRLDLFPQADIRYRVDSTLVLIEAVRAGMAIGSLACYHGDPDPALRRLLPEAITDGVADLWLLTHRDLGRSARVRSFMRFMTEVLGQERARLEGRGPVV